MPNDMVEIPNTIFTDFYNEIKQKQHLSGETRLSDLKENQKAAHKGNHQHSTANATRHFLC